MKATWYETQSAARDVLVVGEMNDPKPRTGEVRIRVAFSGVNPGDVKKREDVNHSEVWRVEVASILHSWCNLRGDDCRRSFVDPRYLREMPLIVLVDREAKNEVGSLSDYRRESDQRGRLKR
jgi:hypothetical protein